MDEFWQLLRSPLLAGTLKFGGLILARLLPLVAFTPIFGGQAVPARFRFGVGVVLALGLLAAVMPPAPPPLSGGLFILLLLKEAVVGLTLAMFLLVLFEAIASAGALSDLLRGATSAQLFDPHVAAQQSVLAVFKMQLAVVLFLSLGGHRVLLEALADSFVAFRAEELLPPRLVTLGTAATMLRLSADLFLVAIQLAAPVLVVTFVVDTALGLVNRVAPQVQVFFLSMTVKGTIGVLVVFLALGVIVSQFRGQFARTLDALRSFIGP